ncbi:MAG: DNA ligase, partial [Acidobacteriota bacterium]
MSGWLDRKISPMLATSGRPFDSPRHLFELKWDGIRALAFFGRGKVRLQGRKLTDSTDRYPEIARALRQLPGEAVLDGEIVVLDDDKPDFERVLVREQARDPGKVAFLARRHP